MTFRSEDWARRGACVGQADRDLDVWHVDSTMLSRKVDRVAAVSLAREVCTGCPVRAQCLDLGLSLLPLLGSDVGMYGGLTAAGLRDEARRRHLPALKQAQHGTRSRYVAGCTAGPAGRACEPCLRAHRDYERHQRAVRSWRENTPAAHGAA